MRDDSEPKRAEQCEPKRTKTTNIIDKGTKLWNSILQHCRMGHVNIQYLQRMSKQGLIDEQLDRYLEFCKPCALAKSSRKTSKTKPLPEENFKPGEAMHMDLKGPFRTKTRNGEEWYLAITDRITNFVKIYLLKTKDEARKYIQSYMSEIKTQTGNSARMWFFDEGTEFKNKFLMKVFESLGMKYYMFTPGDHDPISENKNRTLMETARAMMYTAQCAPTWWGQAIKTAAYLRNRSANKTNNFKTPYECFTGRSLQQDKDIYRVWGCKAYLKLNQRDDRFLSPTSREGIFIGYDDDSETRYHIYIPATKKIFTSRHVEFNENEVIYKHFTVSTPSIIGSVKQEGTAPSSEEYESYRDYLQESSDDEEKVEADEDEREGPEVINPDTSKRTRSESRSPRRDWKDIRRGSRPGRQSATTQA